MSDIGRLEQLYHEISSVILSRQNPVTGLLPASTAVNSHGDYTDAWVRDNVYSIIAPWALSIAYSRQGNSHRQDELEQACVKLMRGLLQSMMQQASKVEKFKTTVAPEDALHAKYSTDTGLPVVADDAWGHLQIDATSLFLLMLAQMTASGLRIIYTYDEVDFIQNLIYYISAAYRTPDYGIWERGNKINNGKTEINASSVGMAKSALLALDGLNLFGTGGSPRAITHTVSDSISLARTSLGALLPRESLSKEVDSALLSVIGFPAFAVGNAELVTTTRDEILKKLGGRYGCKRFLWDGHQTVLEDPTRLYYEHSELANFEHIESEWPLFFAYLYINALFANNEATAKYYRHKIESVSVDVDGMKLIPELYYLPKENIAAEKEQPQSQIRVPNENVPLVWAQSIYYTALLIDENYIQTDDLDRIHLRTRTTQHSQSQIALVVLAENEEVKQTLAQNGVIAESIDEIFPLRVISAPHLVEAYGQVGANASLRLSGRPRRRMRSLATSQTYKINDSECLCLSWLQSENDDYRMCDPALVSSKLINEIAHIRKHWLNEEAAVFTFMVTDEIAQSPTISTLYETLRNLQLRIKDRNVGYASAGLAYRAAKENVLHTPNLCLTPLQNVSAVTNSTIHLDENIKTLFSLAESDEQAAYLYLKELHESDKLTGNDDPLSFIYNLSQIRGHWLLTRLSFILQGRKHAALYEYLSTLNARHLTVIVGANAEQESPLISVDGEKTVASVLSAAANSHVENCLLQETLASIGTLQRTKPHLFEGLRSIHLHSLLKLCVSENKSQWSDEIAENVAKLSPSDLLNCVDEILEHQHALYKTGLSESFTSSMANSESSNGGSAVHTDWFDWRINRGLIVNFDRDFLEDIWQSLAHAKQLIFGDSSSSECVIDCEMVRSSMTPREEIFAQLIDDSIQKLHPHYYKSAIIESILAFTKFCSANPSAKFEDLNLSEQLEIAARKFCQEKRLDTSSVRHIDLLLREPSSVLQSYMLAAFTDAL